MSFLDTVRSYSLRRQLLIGAAAAIALCVPLVAAYFIFLNHPYAALFSNLRTTDAATIVAELDKKKVPYQLDDGGSRILVPSNLVDSTRLGIADEDLPIKGEVGFELFNKSDMGLTEFAQRINYQRALQGELARSIMSIDPVDSARVHLTLAEPTIFRDDRRPSKASVTIITRLGKRLTPDAVLGIQRLVAGAVPDLDASDVVVIDQEGDIVSGSPANLAAASPRTEEQSAVARYYEAKLRRSLAGLLPADAEVTVEVRADPNPSSIDGDDRALDSWTSSQRGFPLTVSLAFPAPPSAAVGSDIRRIASDALGLDPAKGDVLNLTTAAAPPEPSLAPEQASPLAPAQAAISAHPARDVSWLTQALIGALVLLLGGLLAFTRWSNRPRNLTERQRGELAQRLRALLEEGEGHANPLA